MKKGDLVCSKDKTVVGVVVDFSLTLHNVTIAVLWNKPPKAQGCKTFALHNDNVILLPRGTKVTKHFKHGTTDTISYDYYDSVTGIIHGDSDCFTAVDLDGTCRLEFEFMGDIELFDLILDVTKDRKGLEKLYCDMVLYQVLSYAKDKDKTRLNKIEKYLKELIDEVSTQEI